MSKIKPNTWLPLFGVETDWRPPPRYYLSTLFPMYQEDRLATGLGLAGAATPTIPHGEDLGSTTLALHAVSLVEIIPPNNIPIEQDIGATSLSLVSVAVRGVEVPPEDTAGTSRAVLKVQVGGPVVLPDEYGATTRTLQGVSVS